MAVWPDGKGLGSATAEATKEGARWTPEPRAARQ